MQRLIITVPHLLTPSQTKHLREEVGRWLRGDTPILLLDGGCTAQVVDIPEGQIPEVSIEEKQNRLVEQKAKMMKFFEQFDKGTENLSPITVKAEE